MAIFKYVGRTIEMIYQDRSGRLTQRRIRVLAAEDGKIHAYDLDKRAPRVFDANRVLAVQPGPGSGSVKHRVS